jgi:hypothetical protein
MGTRTGYRSQSQRSSDQNSQHRATPILPPNAALSGRGPMKYQETSNSLRAVRLNVGMDSPRNHSASLSHTEVSIISHGHGRSSI